MTAVQFLEDQTNENKRPFNNLQNVEVIIILKNNNNNNNNLEINSIWKKISWIFTLPSAIINITVAAEYSNTMNVSYHKKIHFLCMKVFAI